MPLAYVIKCQELIPHKRGLKDKPNATQRQKVISEIIRAIVRTVKPVVGETVYDPGCGTGGFLAQSYEYMKEALGADTTADQLDTVSGDSERSWTIDFTARKQKATQGPRKNYWT